MPPTNNPTLRQRRLGAELRKLRERAGLTAKGAGEPLGVHQTRLSVIETRRTPVSADRIHSMAHACVCPDAALIDALAAMTGRRSRGWWEETTNHARALFWSRQHEIEHRVTHRIKHQGLDTVQLDTHHGCEFLYTEAQLNEYRSVLDRMESNALKPAESRDLIHRLAQET
ncbi:helix-turn-helix transcriptional regulator [Streptomyces fungicidicus]|uniref:helix-turn-helix transcriptional regulator n=1 Tax=Streptomyces fungicidicus TaxID=68203 RepID=UPI0033D86105